LIAPNHLDGIFPADLAAFSARHTAVLLDHGDLIDHLYGAAGAEPFTPVVPAAFLRVDFGHKLNDLNRLLLGPKQLHHQWVRLGPVRGYETTADTICWPPVSALFAVSFFHENPTRENAPKHVAQIIPVFHVKRLLIVRDQGRLYQDLGQLCVA